MGHNNFVWLQGCTAKGKNNHVKVEKKLVSKTLKVKLLVGNGTKELSGWQILPK
jgi:hypothetical protein